MITALENHASKGAVHKLQIKETPKMLCKKFIAKSETIQAKKWNGQVINSAVYRHTFLLEERVLHIRVIRAHFIRF